jgi:hypothetical protein
VSTEPAAAQANQLAWKRGVGAPGANERIVDATRRAVQRDPELCRAG